MDCRKRRHRREARMKKISDPRLVRRWGKKLLFHLRWNENGPRGGPISFEKAVKLSGLTPEKIDNVRSYDVHEGRFQTWTQQGILFLRARKSRGATDSSKPQSEETVHDSQCPICYADLTNLDVTRLRCNHKFCARCAWFSGRQCALCRRDRPPGMFHDTRNVPMDFTSDGFDSSEVDSSSDSEDSSQRRLDELFREQWLMLHIECSYCETSWIGWNCFHCRRTH